MPIGIDETTINFLNTFLLFCLLRKSPPSSKTEYKEIQHNFSSVVTEGRKPGLNLSQNGEAVALTAWAHEILEESLEVADLLDSTCTTSSYQDAVKEQLAKVADSDLTPSAQVLTYMRENNISYFPFALEQSKKSAEYLQNKLSQEQMENFREITLRSNQDRVAIEQSDKLSFDEFLVQANLS